MGNEREGEGNATSDEIPVAAALIDELDRRMDEHRRNPENVTSWAAIRAACLERRRPDE